MPIYAYKCDACGFAQDVLQKMSAAPLTVCPSCGAERFVKQVTAAAFQLKGSGWYVTDFRNDGKGAPDGKGAAGEAAKGDAPAAPATAPAASDGKPATSSPAPAPAAATPAPSSVAATASAPAAGSATRH